MNPRVCICCGEGMGEKDNLFSRNPNLCASCSSLADGMDDSGDALMTRKPPANFRNLRVALLATPDSGDDAFLD